MGRIVHCCSQDPVSCLNLGSLLAQQQLEDLLAMSKLSAWFYHYIEMSTALVNPSRIDILSTPISAAYSNKYFAQDS
jgi:hypothetical protein